MALSLESIKQLAALDGKGSRENMIRAGQALLMQLLAAGMFRSLRMNGEEALLAAQNGKNLMLIEIEGQLCIAPANEALQKLLANTVKGAQLSARAMNGLLSMSETELAALTGKTVAEIESAGLRALWIKENAIVLTPNFSTLGLAKVITHVKYRDYTVDRATGGIGGAHDKNVFANYSSEYVIIRRTPLNVPGVEKIEYQLYALDKTGQPTGLLKAKIYTKTVYDPVIWPDARLQTALEEAFQYAFNKNRGLVPRQWTGITKEGYSVRGYYENGEITSFFFE